MRTAEQIFTDTIEVKQRILADPEFLERVRTAGNLMVESLSSGGRLYTAGNGGSAADAQHFTAELTGHFTIKRPPIPAEALHANPSHLTAVANDYDYETVFARALQASARVGDVFVGFTTSGNSASIVSAAKLARESGVRVIGMTGQWGGRLAEHADVLLNVPSTDTGRIQESHVVLLHILSEQIEHALYPQS